MSFLLYETEIKAMGGDVIVRLPLKKHLFNKSFIGDLYIKGNSFPCIFTVYRFGGFKIRRFRDLNDEKIVLSYLRTYLDSLPLADKLLYYLKVFFKLFISALNLYTIFIILLYYRLSDLRILIPFICILIICPIIQHLTNK